MKSRTLSTALAVIITSLSVGLVLPSVCRADDAAINASLPAGIQDVVKLAKAGLDEDVIIAQVKSSGASYKLTSEQIIYLTNAGVSQNVIKALLQTGSASPATTAAPAGEASVNSSYPGAVPPTQNSAGPAAPGDYPTVAAQAPSSYSSMAAPAPSEMAQPPPPVTIDLPSNVRWLDTGIDLAPGSTVSINANGAISAFYKAMMPLVGIQMLPTINNQGPDGVMTYDSNRARVPFIAPGLRAYSLIARVGRNRPFEIGSSTTFNSPGGGRLYLSVNANSFDGNRGYWSVTISQLSGSNEGPATPVQAAQVSFDYFQAQLMPYGNWIQSPSYGLAWSPAEAVNNPAWRPYADQGQWVYTDSGLYWSSGYAWGDIAFHYGRWAYDNGNGWLWVPGYDWAPAWVAWRNSESAGFTGWAPLPPSAQFVSGVGLMYNGMLAADTDFGLPAEAFVFVGYDHLWDRDYSAFFLPRDRIRYFYGSSVVRNGYRIEGGRFVVEGLGRERLGFVTHRDVRVLNTREIRSREETAHVETRRVEVDRSRIEGRSVAPNDRSRVVAPQNQRTPVPGVRPQTVQGQQRPGQQQVQKAPAKPAPVPAKAPPEKPVQQQ